MLSRKARILEEGTVPEGTKTTAAIRWKFDPSAEKAKEMWFAEKTNFLFRGTVETMMVGGEDPLVEESQQIPGAWRHSPRQAVPK